jgi:2-C-methyl-D-erythritol 4-phosphate cytidylyltransferase/2-C-methyl-D-erythritol 2,4-cyclodiphosphate synthase
MGIPVRFVDAHYDNIKVTTREDIDHGRHIVGEQTRIGTGYDAHQLKEGRPLVLGGVSVPHTHGLLGHSDADVLVHAIMDAMLGAAAMGDIGQHFPCSDDTYKGISSIELLKRTLSIITAEGFRIVNIDATLILQRPKIAPYIAAMRQNIATALGIGIGAVSVKATTTEGMGFEGRGEGASAMASAVLMG